MAYGCRSREEPGDAGQGDDSTHDDRRDHTEPHPEKTTDDAVDENAVVEQVVRPEQSRLFTTWTDQESGVTSYVLTSRAAPQQQSFYFVNPSFTTDGRYLWFYCFFPPSGDHNYGRCLAVADLVEESLRYFPDTAFLDASPMIDIESGDAYWVSGRGIYKRSPDPEAPAIRINTFPDSLARGRRPHRIATHLTRSADGASLSLDAQIGLDWYVGDAPLDGSPIRVWQRFDRCYNHAQFSPTDPDLLLLAQDFWSDPVTGTRHGIDHRLWLIHRGHTAQPLGPPPPDSAAVNPVDPSGVLTSHEWWSPKGRHVYYIDTRAGTRRIDITTGETQTMWPAGTGHSHASSDGSLFVGDVGIYTWESTGCRVLFYNATTRREIAIASTLPVPTEDCRRYHVHPHPQFCFGDRYICYTTTINGRVDLALVPVARLVERTSR